MGKMMMELQEENKKWARENLKEGMKLKGRVKNIQPYGAFVTIKKGVDGLLPLRNISNSRIKSPSEILKKNDVIDVSIEKYNKNTGKIIFSHKEFLGTWEENVNNFQVGQETEGIVRNRISGGIFIELMPNLVGLAEHRSDLEYGEKVKVRIKKISPDNHKIKLVILD